MDSIPFIAPEAIIMSTAIILCQKARSSRNRWRPFRCSAGLTHPHIKLGTEGPSTICLRVDPIPYIVPEAIIMSTAIILCQKAGIHLDNMDGERPDGLALLLDLNYRQPRVNSSFDPGDTGKLDRKASGNAVLMGSKQREIICDWIIWTDWTCTLGKESRLRNSGYLRLHLSVPRTDGYLVTGDGNWYHEP